MLAEKVMGRGADPSPILFAVRNGALPIAIDLRAAPL